MIDPPPAAIIAGSTARLNRKDPVRLTASTRSQSGKARFQDRAAGIMGSGPAHQNIQPAKLFLRSGGGCLGLSFDGNVAAPGNGLPAGGHNQPRRFGCCRLIDVAAGDSHSGVGEGQRNRPADAPSCAADERRLSGQRHPAVFTASPCRHRSRWFGR